MQIAVGMFNPINKEGMITINVAYHMDFAGAAVAAIDKNMRFFEEEGLNVKFVPFISGHPEIAAMTSGNIQLGYLGSESTVLSTNGQIKIIYFQNIGNSEGIITSKKNGFNTVKDLEHKIVATSLGTSGENFLKLAMEQSDLIGNDIKIINMDMNGCLTAMLNSKVDAVSVWDTYRYILEDKMGGDFQILADSSDFINTYCSISSWAASEDFILANQKTVKAFTRALGKSLDYWEDNKEQVAKWTSELLGKDYNLINRQSNSYILMNSNQLKKSLSDGTLSALYKKQLEGFINTGRIKFPIEIDNYIIWDYMEKAVEQK
ncbi:MAG: ABC transporter substrate-binding protein [Spirochaetaceae bacterium]|nr:ABC transporter substrate-binding protein [Spirochaetaceae bacterium]